MSSTLRIWAEFIGIEKEIGYWRIAADRVTA